MYAYYAYTMGDKLKIKWNIRIYSILMEIHLPNFLITHMIQCEFRYERILSTETEIIT